MIILGIDTSCDDTSVAIVEADKRGYQRGLAQIKFNILSSIISSQVKIHAQYGGVYPFLAKREHQKNLPVVFEKALKRAKISVKEIDFIALTVGPGLEPCLWVGVNFVKELAKELKLPIIPVNHIEAHIFANFVGNVKCQMSNVKTLLPAICLVVSGGHTQLILMKNFGEYKILGETRDDAAGECLDKVARILGLGYPGGPAIEKKSKIKNRASIYGNEGEEEFEEDKSSSHPFAVARENEVLIAGQKSKIKIKLPRPMIYQKNYDFSFSGLKTAVLYQYQKSKTEFPFMETRGKKSSKRINPLLTPSLSLGRMKFSSPIKNKKYKQAMAAEVQQAVIDVLIYKTLKATKEFKAKSIILGGGVAANEELRRQFKVQSSLPTGRPAKFKVNFFVPPKKFCTDNAAMVGITAFFHYLKGESRNWQKIFVNANLRI